MLVHHTRWHWIYLDVRQAYVMDDFGNAVMIYYPTTAISLRESNY
jgi:hypothetical protein